MAGYMCSTCGRVKETADYGESCSCNRGWFDKRYESDEEATDEAAEKRVLAVFARYQRAMQRHGGAGNRGPADTLIIAATLTAAHLAVCSATARSPVSTEGK